MSSLVPTVTEEETCVPIVKNTFICLQRECAYRSRRKSIPASLRLFLESPTEEGADSQKDKPRAASDASAAFGGGDSDSRIEPPPRSNSQRRQREASMRYKHDFDKVIKRAMKPLQESDLVSHVQKFESSQSSLLVVQLNASGCAQKKRVLDLAQKALLDAAVPSKSIYVLGYCSPNAFISNETGFETKFVAMDNARTACWHLFRKGKCRHGDACYLRHQVWAMPTRVLVEGNQRAAPEAMSMQEIKVES